MVVLLSSCTSSRTDRVVIGSKNFTESLILGELVAGYRAGMVEWNAARLGPPPGSPGCRVDAAVLRENGYGEAPRSRR